ncbi:hypothetical protein ACH3XW_7290 [Acanthocheilonema viteae]|uniref:Uncharacterized protein n=1 Tax=Acanthocheilonema viteae TaxID=6277 RepID=A0A498SRE5_ACAVI|nr:unnamed protein product [Acanthocheilonema viteae]
MACTLQSLRIGRTFDSDYPQNQKALSDDTSLSIAVIGQVDELKITPEETCPKKSVMLAYKLYKYRDKLVSLIDGSRGQYRSSAATLIKPVYGTLSKRFAQNFDRDLVVDHPRP